MRNKRIESHTQKKGTNKNRKMEQVNIEQKDQR